jgi:hypothetical protein
MAVVGFLLVPSTPLIQSLAPIAGTTLLLVPAVAVCTVLGWAAGGRSWLVALWVSLAAAALLLGAPPRSTYGAMERGWVLVLVASFGLISAASPAATRFLPRALTALAATVAFVGLLTLGTRGAVTVADRAVRGNAEARPNAALDWIRQTASTPEWRTWTTHSPQGNALDAAEQTMDGVLATLPRDAVPLYPALLGLESLSALALAWGLFHRISRTRIGEPLGGLRDFRFSDQLAWGLIAGAALVLLPPPGAWRMLGLNLLLFFGVLYAVRGLAVLVWYLRAAQVSAPAIAALAVIAGLLSAPAAIGLGLVGLGDSWIDWRSRPRPATSRPLG